MASVAKCCWRRAAWASAIRFSALISFRCSALTSASDVSWVPVFAEPLRAMAEAGTMATAALCKPNPAVERVLANIVMLPESSRSPVVNVTESAARFSFRRSGVRYRTAGRSTASEQAVMQERPVPGSPYTALTH
jgi:hypothetical protein